jgi:hypothetical protein
MVRFPIFARHALVEADHGLRVTVPWLAKG